MKKAKFADREVLPELQKIGLPGRHAQIASTKRATAKNARSHLHHEGGKLAPIAIIKAARRFRSEDFVKASAPPPPRRPPQPLLHRRGAVAAPAADGEGRAQGGGEEVVRLLRDKQTAPSVPFFLLVSAGVTSSFSSW